MLSTILPCIEFVFKPLNKTNISSIITSLGRAILPSRCRNLLFRVIAHDHRIFLQLIRAVKNSKKMTLIPAIFNYELHEGSVSMPVNGGYSFLFRYAERIATGDSFT